MSRNKKIITTKYKARQPNFATLHDNNNEGIQTSELSQNHFTHETTTRHVQKSVDIDNSIETNTIENHSINNSENRSIYDGKYENEDYPGNANDTTIENVINYDKYEPNTYEWETDMTTRSNNEENDETDIKEKDEENGKHILKQNVEEIFDQLTNLEMLVQSLHEKIDAIADRLL